MPYERARWAFRLAPLSSVVVWAGLVAAGNRGWIDGWFTSAPVSVVLVLTAITGLVGFGTIKAVASLSLWMRGGVPPARWTWVPLGTALGALWGCVLRMIGTGYPLAGLLCGAVTGLALAIALRPTYRDFSQPSIALTGDADGTHR